MAKRFSYIRDIVFLLLFIITIIGMFPGTYSTDTWNYYSHMVTAEYGDWHSPFLQFLWHVLMSLTGTMHSMYVWQMLLYWIFFYLLLRYVTKNYVFIIGVVLAVFFLFIPQYIIKDTHLCIYWGLAGVLLIRDALFLKSKRFIIPIILLLLFAGFLIRVSAIVAFLPLLYIFVDRYLVKRKTMIKLAATIGVCLLMVGLNSFISYTLLGAKKEYPEYKFMFQDVIGISKLSGKNYIPECITSHQGFNMDSVMNNYSAASIDHIYWADGRDYFPYPTQEKMDCLSSSWKKAIIENPGLYFQNRGDGFLRFLRLKRNPDGGHYWNVAIFIEKANPINYQHEVSLFARNIELKAQALGEIYFYEPWLWLLFNLALAVYYYRVYRKYRLSYLKVNFFIQLSGLFYLLSYFLIYQTDRDFRYLYWNVITVIIGFIYLLDRPAKKDRLSIK